MKRKLLLILIAAWTVAPWAARAEIAVYSATLRTPQCSSTFGPCEAKAELLQSRDNSATLAEANQPNTLNSSPCADGTGGTFHDHQTGGNSESIDSVVILDPNGGNLKIGDTIQVQTDFYIFDATRDEIDLFYTNNITTPAWTLIRNETGGWGQYGEHRRVYSFKLTGAAGNQAVRVQISRNGTSKVCETTTRSDRDDVVIAVAANTDTDGDGLIDYWENLYPCMNVNASDANLDYDNDGLTNAQESLHETNPCVADTDGGGEADGAEVAAGLDPLQGFDDFGENAVYSAAYTCPNCSTGLSPCYVPPSLIVGRDNMTGQAEPHQPNTINTSTCADGTLGEYLDDESTDKFIVTDLSNKQFLPGDTVEVEAWVWCWYPSTTNSLYVYSSDYVSGSSLSWKYQGTDYCRTVGFRKLTVDFKLGNVAGNQVIRTAFTYASPAASCDAGDYNDRDDVVLKVLSPTDTDLDGLVDEEEIPACTAENNPDSDGDGLCDGNVDVYSGSTLVCRAGEDLNLNGRVDLAETDPCNPDTDGDGMPDGYEVAHACLNALVADAGADPDGDGLTNLTEYTNGSNPCLDDSDGDGHNDNADCNPTNPNVWTSCATCQDLDADGWYAGCDAYTTINGPDCDDSAATGASCHNTCATFYADADGDAHGNPASTVTACSAPAGHVADNTDCNDTDPNVWSSCATCADTDADSWFAGCDAYVTINGPDCAPANAGHWNDCGTCTDADGDNYGAGCNLGADCDDSVATGGSCHNTCATFSADADGDAHGNPAATVTACSAPAGHVADNTDCNDADPNVWSSCATCADTDADSWFDGCDAYVTINGPDCAPASANHWNDCGTCTDADGDNYGAGCNLGPDCDDSVPTGASCHNACATFYADADGDAHGNPAATVTACSAPAGYVADNTDCNDTDPNVWSSCATCADPDADSWFDGCDAYVTINGPDCAPASANHWNDCGTCTDADGDNYGAGCNLGPDCDDSVATGGSCHNTCATFSADADGDAHGNPAATVTACSAPAGYVADNTDCDDAAATVHPGAAELCDGIDNQCPGDPGFGQVDEGCGPLDSDGDGLTDTMESNTVGTDPLKADTDDDGIADGVEWDHQPCYDPLNADSDGDGLCDGNLTVAGTCVAGEDLNGNGIQDPGETSACDADSDHDGLNDLADRGGCLSPLDWDSDNDSIPDGFEAANISNHPAGQNLDPCLPTDAPLDFDGDRNSNLDEYWNGTDLWSADPMPSIYANMACFYWADGDGDGIPAPSDIIMLKLEIVSVHQDYRLVIPSTFDTLDLDKDGYAAPSDLILLKLMVAGSERPGGYPSAPKALNVDYAPAADVAAGMTTHVTVSVDNFAMYVPKSGGFGVVFWIESGPGVMLGGDGTDSNQIAGNRYQVSRESAAGGKATITVLVTGPGPITLHAFIPACGTEPFGRWSRRTDLAAPIVITGR